MRLIVYNLAVLTPRRAHAWSDETMSAERALIHLYLELMKKAVTASIYEESAWELVKSHRPSLRTTKPLRLLRELMEHLLLRHAKNKNLLLVKRGAFDISKRDNGADWPVIGYTMAGHKRLDNIQMCFEDVLMNQVPGDLIETGVWRGGTTIFMRALLKAYAVTDRKVWVADSFQGLPVPKHEDDGSDLSYVDYLKVSVEQVRSNFMKFDLLDEQVEFLQGWFCDTLPNAPIKSIAILRLDGDMYSSTMDSLQALHHRVSKGGYVIVDDYYSWPSCRRAVTDFLRAKSIEPDIKTIDWTGAYWRCS